MEKAEDRNLRRSYWQTLNVANPSRRFWGRVIVGVLFVMPIVAFFATDMLINVMNEISRLDAVGDQATIIVHQLRSVGFLFLSVILMLCLLCLYFVFFLSVRVYGPQVALLRFIEQLKTGNYEPYRSLRKDDQLKEIWQALQDLAEALRKKQPR